MLERTDMAVLLLIHYVPLVSILHYKNTSLTLYILQGQQLREDSTGNIMFPVMLPSGNDCFKRTNPCVSKVNYWTDERCLNRQPAQFEPGPTTSVGQAADE